MSLLLSLLFPVWNDDRKIQRYDLSKMMGLIPARIFQNVDPAIQATNATISRLVNSMQCTEESSRRLSSEVPSNSCLIHWALVCVLAILY